MLLRIFGLTTLLNLSLNLNLSFNLLESHGQQQQPSTDFGKRQYCPMTKTYKAKAYKTKPYKTKPKAGFNLIQLDPI